MELNLLYRVCNTFYNGNWHLELIKERKEKKRYSLKLQLTFSLFLCLLVNVLWLAITASCLASCVSCSV